MRDFYYILGVKHNSSNEEIRKAYRKLSFKFHPDKNDGDEFFTERFKEIQEAYETLSDSKSRAKYDSENGIKGNSYESNKQGNIIPAIVFFKVNKIIFETNEEITFSWKTLNCDKVQLKPFGIVPSNGQKTYRIKDVKNSSLTFELIAENTIIKKQLNSKISIKNKSYKGSSDNNKQGSSKQDAEKRSDDFVDTKKTTFRIKNILNLFYSLLILSVIVLVVYNFINSATSNIQLMKKWRFSGMQSQTFDRMMAETDAKCMAMDDSMKNCTDTTKMKEFKSQKELMETQKKWMTSMMDKMKAEGWIEFTKEGKYKQNMSGTEDEGTYSMDEAGKMLMTTDSKGKTDTLNIDELTASAMTLSTPKDSTKIMFTADAGEAK